MQGSKLEVIKFVSLAQNGGKIIAVYVCIHIIMVIDSNEFTFYLYKTILFIMF